MSFFVLFVFNDTATTEIFSLSLHDALPISAGDLVVDVARVVKEDEADDGEGDADDGDAPRAPAKAKKAPAKAKARSEEHTSELQSPCNLVCRLLLEQKRN